MQNKGKTNKFFPSEIKQNRILTAIVGSYPKPKYIYPKSGRQLLDNLGFSFNEKNRNLDKACIGAIRAQNEAGLDIITDGEERRSHYVFHILKGLEGFDFKNLKRVPYRGGILYRDVPTVSRPIKYKKPILVKEFKFTKQYSQGVPKIGLPGPSTVVDCIADEYYKGNLEKMAYDYAKAIRNEVKGLIKAGCQVIQFDDPVLLRFPDRAKQWGIQALEECFRGFENDATFIVHICCGYPNKPLEAKGINYKANHNYYWNVLKWLSKSRLDVVSIEGAQSKLDLSVLPAIGEKTVMLGVLDVGEERAESIKELVKRGKEALKYLPANQLILAPDCGMLELSQLSAKQKLKNLGLAAQILNGRDI